jgi:hypothetical protein
MRIAIILAVSDYPNEIGKLPACRVDGEVMNAIFSTESRFDSVITIDGNKPSITVKRQLTEFITGLSGQDIEEIVFYFSGHGEFINNEFHYLLSDYEAKRRRATTLENTELDNLLKSLNPKLTVKLIDACHSGMTYIKDPEHLQTYLKGTQGVFKKCYFLFSSQQDKPSYQDNSLSFFTKSIAESILAHTNSEMRYKDLIDFVSDAFDGTGTQTPFFVAQADFTEIFCSVSATLRESIRRKILRDDSKSKISAPDSKELTLLERVKLDANRFCDEETVYSTIQELKSLIVIDNPEIQQLYEVRSIEITDFNSLPNPNAIGVWIDKNPIYFAKPHFEQVFTQRRSTGAKYGNLRDFDHIIASRESEFEPKPELRIRGFRPTIDLPYLFIELILEPRFLNIPMHKCYFVPIVSRTEAIIFFCRVTYKEVGWNKLEQEAEAKWSLTSVPHRDRKLLQEAIGVALREQSRQILLDLEEKFCLGSNPDEQSESELGVTKTEKTPPKPPKDLPKK